MPTTAATKPKTSERKEKPAKSADKNHSKKGLDSSPVKPTSKPSEKESSKKAKKAKKASSAPRPPPAPSATRRPSAAPRPLAAPSATRSAKRCLKNLARGKHGYEGAPKQAQTAPTAKKCFFFFVY